MRREKEATRLFGQVNAAGSLTDGEPYYTVAEEVFFSSMTRLPRCEGRTEHGFLGVVNVARWGWK